MDNQGKLSITEALTNLTSDSLVFTEGERCYMVQAGELSKMDAMGLGHLPIETIGIPENSPLLERPVDSASPHILDISHHLCDFFPNYFVVALYELQSLLNKANAKGFVVGGISRDLLLFKERRFEIQDVDISIEGDAVACAQFIADNSHNFVLDHAYPEFGTAKLHYKTTLIFDLASTRSEHYPSCGALPVVLERGVPLREDIIRRDFTINALAFSINDLGQLYDFSNGILDIENRCLRILHASSFFEDPSRILRAFKFLSRLDFDLSLGTKRLLEQFLKHITSVYKGGGERIKLELKEFLLQEESLLKNKWLTYFITTGCIRLVNTQLSSELPLTLAISLPMALERLPHLQVVLEDYYQPNLLWQIYLCLLFGGLNEAARKETYQRLVLTKQERESIELFAAYANVTSRPLEQLQEQCTPLEIYEIFHPLPFSSAIALTLLSSKFEIALEALKFYKQKWENLKVELKGQDLIAMGIPQGEQIGIILKSLKHCKLSGRLHNRQEEIQYVRQLFLADDKALEA